MAIVRSDFCPFGFIGELPQEACLPAEHTSTGVAFTRSGLTAAEEALAGMRAAGTAAGFSASDDDQPLVSVATVTRRAEFVEDAVANFERQAYRRRELVVVVNAGEDLLARWRAIAGSRPCIRVWHAPGHTLGACRNAATSAALGDFVAMFDDDDLYGPGYLSEAVAVLRETDAAMVTKREYLWLDGAAGTFRYKGEPGAWSHSLREAGGCTQVFRRAWHRPDAGISYAEISCGEDYAFSRAVADRGGLVVASGPGQFVRRRNLWPGHAHAWNGRLGSFRLEDHERLPISPEQAYRLAGIPAAS